MVWSEALLAQFTNVMISNTNDPEEVSICINPKNLNQVAAGANINNAYNSTDGGQTWNVGVILDHVNGVWGDPCIFTDTAGDFYYIHLSDPLAGSWIDRIVCAKSTNGGATWGAGTYMGLNGTKAQDKAWVAVNPANNEFYVTWTQFDVYGSANAADSSVILFSKSSDGGQTWSPAKRISKFGGDCIDSDNTVEGAVPTVGPNGEIYVAWVGAQGIVFNKSLDGGLTWLPQETAVTSVPGGWDYNIAGLQRSNGLPITICDLSGGPNHGTIYINWSDQRNGSTDTDVWLIKSTDGGQSWSAPKRVNDDAPGRQQFLTWMTLDRSNGYIYCVFYDRRNFAANSQLTDVYLARSVDGGNTFTNFKINQNSFTPDPGTFFGDYTGIAAQNQMIRPIWMEYDGVGLSVWTALISDNMLGIETSHLNAYSPVDLGQNSPNPFNESTWINFRLKQYTYVSLYVYDVLGNKIATLYENEIFGEGNYDYIFNAAAYQLKPGIYYYSLEYEGKKVTKKMTVYQ